MLLRHNVGGFTAKTKAFQLFLNTFYITPALAATGACVWQYTDHKTLSLVGFWLFIFFGLCYLKRLRFPS